MITAYFVNIIFVTLKSITKRLSEKFCHTHSVKIQLRALHRTRPITASHYFMEKKLNNVNESVRFSKQVYYRSLKIVILKKSIAFLKQFN